MKKVNEFINLMDERTISRGYTLWGFMICDIKGNPQLIMLNLVMGVLMTLIYQHPYDRQGLNPLSRHKEKNLKCYLPTISLGNLKTPVVISYQQPTTHTYTNDFSFLI